MKYEYVGESVFCWADVWNVQEQIWTVHSTKP
jgi:hypothetical protein